MKFMKKMLALTLISTTLMQQSWSIASSSSSSAEKDKVRVDLAPKVCLLMVDFISGDSNQNTPFESFMAKYSGLISDGTLYPIADKKNNIPGDEAKIRELYKLLMLDLGNDPVANCMTKLNGLDKTKPNYALDLFTRDRTNDAGPAASGSTMVSNVNLSHKEKERVGGTCAGNLNITCKDDEYSSSALDREFTGWLDFAQSKKSVQVSDVAYDEADCTCHHDNLVLKGKSTEKMGPEIDLEIQRIKDIVVQESAKKFVNSYSALNEDLRYYPAAATELLQYKGGEHIPEQEKLCQDPSGFQKAVDELCAKNGMTAGSAERMSHILSALDPKLKNLKFSDALAALNDDIGVLELPKSAQKDGVGKKLYRSDYDRARKVFGEDRKEPEIIFANRMITEMLGESSIQKNLKQRFKDEQEPIFALIDIMSDPANDKFMDRMLKTMNSDFAPYKLTIFDQLIKLKEEQKTHRKSKTADTNDAFRTAVGNMFFKGMNMNPGFKNLLMDRQLFTDISKKFSPSNYGDTRRGLFGIMTNDKAVLMKRMAERCGKLKEELAQNVCTKPEDILRNVRTSEVVGLIKDGAYALSSNEDAVNMAMCSFSKNKPDKKSVFSQTQFDNINKADYTNRKLNPVAQDNPFFKVAVMFQDKKKAEQVSQMVSYGVNENNSSGKYKASANHDADQMVSFKSLPKVDANSVASNSAANTHTVVPEALSNASRDIASTKEFEVPKTVAPASIPSSSAAFIPAASIAPTAQEEAKIAENLERVSRERLAKELSDSDNKHRVKEHISSVNEKDAEEIFRLRDQAIKDRQTISELRLQQERDKTEALRSEYEQLKTRFDNLEKTNAAPVVAKAPSVTTGGTGSSEGNLPRFETATLSAPVANGSTGGRSSGLNSPASSSASAGAATLSDSNSGSSNATGANSSSSTTVSTTGGGTGSDARGLALTVTQSVGSDGKGHAAEDPNKALISYLTKNEPTASQLQELKTSGLVLTEEDVNVDGQKVQKKKMIKFNELSPEAKSLVEQKLAHIKLQEVKRNYSRQALILELFSASMKKSNLNVKKSGSLNF